MPLRKDNIKLKLRIRELEEQVEELQKSKEDETSDSSSDEDETKASLSRKDKAMKSTFGEVKQTTIKPPIFRGTEAEDFSAWLRNYEQVTKVNKWSVDFCLNHIPTVLQDEANLKYWDCTDDEREDWHKLIKVLGQKFSPESNRATFEAALETRTRRTGETLDKFMTELKSLSKKAYPEWETKYRDKLVKKYFVDGLDDTLRMLVLQANPKSSDDALQAALRSDANMKKKVSVQSHGASALVGTAQTPGTDQLADAIAIALERRGIGHSTIEQSPTHFDSEYVNRYDRSFNVSGRGRSRGSGRGRGRGWQTTRGTYGACHACGQQGHFWRDAVCPKSPLSRGSENSQGVGNQ